MNMSFYVGALGAGSEQAKLNVVANNIANVNTQGFKAENATFYDLIYKNMNAPEDADTRLLNGVGMRLEKTDTQYRMGALTRSYEPLDFAILEDGYFALLDPETQQISYTRDGSFRLSYMGDESLDGSYNLVSKEGLFVLDKEGNPITMVDEKTIPDIGVYDFTQNNGMEHVGENRFIPTEKNGDPVLLEDAELLTGYLEGSNVDLPFEITEMIETQNAYRMAIKMVQTSDDVEGEINSLRQ